MVVNSQKKEKMLGMCHGAIATDYYSKQGQRMLKGLPQHNKNEKEQTNNEINKRSITAITEEQLDINDLMCYNATKMANIFLSSKLTKMYNSKGNQTSLVPLFMEIYIFIITKIEGNNWFYWIQGLQI